METPVYPNRNFRIDNILDNLSHFDLKLSDYQQKLFKKGARALTCHHCCPCASNFVRALVG